jgi:ribosome-associated toxin RatA of RatAB toxin-antitoxin module
MMMRANFRAEEAAISTQIEFSMKDSMVGAALGQVFHPVHLNTKEKLA